MIDEKKVLLVTNTHVLYPLNILQMSVEMNISIYGLSIDRSIVNILQSTHFEIGIC